MVVRSSGQGRADKHVAAGRLLEGDCREDRVVGVGVAVGHDDELVVIVVEPVDDRNPHAIAGSQRLRRPEQVGVEALAVGATVPGTYP